MSKQLLIESCEIVSKVKLNKSLKESVKLSQGKNGTLIVRNVPCTILNKRNLNGRIYSTEVMRKAIDDARLAMQTKQLLCQACEHPEQSYCSPTTVSHVVTDAYIKENISVVVDGKRGKYDVLFMDWEVLNTDEGRNLRALLEAECSIGTSIRGLGDLNGDMVESYSILGVDIVGQPSSGTFTRMPISESAKVSIEDREPLSEGFTVTTTSTDVASDLENAARIQINMEDARYGTVTKIGTKVDQENDPKTGAQTKITTVEGETSDDVETLDQALRMARNAFLNGSTHVDTVTIENIKEEEKTTKESVDSEEGGLENPDAEYMSEDEINAELGVASDADTLTEAKDDTEEKDPKEGRKFVLKAPAGFVGMDGNALVFKQDPKEALHFIVGKEESGLVHLSGVQKILDTMGVYDIEKYFRKPESEIADDVNTISTDSTDTAVSEDKPVEEGLTGGIAGGVAGGALGAATGNPIDALSGAAAGYSLGSDVADDLSEASDDTGSKYKAEVHIAKKTGGEETDTIPVSATDNDAMLSEVSNLWSMKSKKDEGKVTVYVIDNTNGSKLVYNPESNRLEPVNEEAKQEVSTDAEAQAPVQEQPVAVDPATNEVEQLTTEAIDDSAIKQDGTKLSMDLDDETHVEKDFGDMAKASVAKAGLEDGKLTGDVMLSEKEGEEPKAKMSLKDFLAHCPEDCDDLVCAVMCGIKEVDPEYFDTIPEDKDITVKDLDSMLKEIGVDIKSDDEEVNDSDELDESDDFGFEEILNGYRFRKGDYAINAIKGSDGSWNIDVLKGDAPVTDTHSIQLDSKEELLDLAEEIFDNLDIKSIDTASDDELFKPKGIKPGWYVGADGIGVSGPYDTMEEAMSGLEDYSDSVSVENITQEDIDESMGELDERLFLNKSPASDDTVEFPLEDDMKNQNSEQK